MLLLGGSMDFGIDSGVMFMSPVVKTSGAACSAVPVHIYLIAKRQNGRRFFGVNRRAARMTWERLSAQAGRRPRPHISKSAGESPIPATPENTIGIE